MSKQISPCSRIITLMIFLVVAPLQSFCSPLFNPQLEFWVNGDGPIAVPFAVKGDTVFFQINIIVQVDPRFAQSDTMVHCHLEGTPQELIAPRLPVLSVSDRIFDDLEFSFCDFRFWFWGNLTYSESAGRIRMTVSAFQCLLHQRGQETELSESCVGMDRFLTPVDESIAMLPINLDRVIDTLGVKEFQQYSDVMQSLLSGPGSVLVFRFNELHDPLVEIPIVAELHSFRFLDGKFQLQHLGLGFPFGVINADLSAVVDVFSRNPIFPFNPVVGGLWSFVYGSHMSSFLVSQIVSQKCSNSVQCHRVSQHILTNLNGFEHIFTDLNIFEHMDHSCGTTDVDKNTSIPTVYDLVSHKVSPGLRRETRFVRMCGWARSAALVAQLGQRLPLLEWGWVA